LSVSYGEVGNAQLKQGDPTAALASYQASLAIMDRLTQTDPGNVGWQRDLSVSNNHVGDAQIARGDASAARSSTRRASRS